MSCSDKSGLPHFDVVNEHIIQAVEIHSAAREPLFDAAHRFEEFGLPTESVATIDKPDSPTI
jgi:hypothetical protein